MYAPIGNETDKVIMEKEEEGRTEQVGAIILYQV